MNMSHFNDPQVSIPADSGGENSFDNRLQSRIRNRQSFSIHSHFDFKKPKMPLSINRSKLSIPYKSELCLLFQRGKCYYGENCHFSHSISEIRKPGFNTAAVEEHLNDDTKRSSVWKIKECYYFSSGVDCPYGDRCQYLHKCDQNVRRDVGLSGESYAVRTVNGGSVRSASDIIECQTMNAGEHQDNSVFRKTKLCINWERFGSCSYGVKCKYAHGRAEFQEPGSFAEPENSCTSRLKLISQPNPAISSETVTKIAKKLQLKGKRCFMKWDIEKVSQIYADWMDDRHNFHVSFSQVGS